MNYFFGVRASLINVEDYTADESADEQPENDQRRRRRVRVRPGAGQPEYVRGFRVNSVVPRSPAARAGLEPGDVMVEANGRLLNSWRAFDGAISASRGKLSLVVLNVRNGQLTPVRVQLEKQQQRVRR